MINVPSMYSMKFFKLKYETDTELRFDNDCSSGIVMPEIEFNQCVIQSINVRIGKAEYTFKVRSRFVYLWIRRLFNVCRPQLLLQPERMQIE